MRLRTLLKNKFVISIILILIAAAFLLKSDCTNPKLECKTMSPTGFTEPMKAFCSYEDANEWAKLMEYKRGNIICSWGE